MTMKELMEYMKNLTDLELEGKKPKTTMHYQMLMALKRKQERLGSRC